MSEKKEILVSTVTEVNADDGRNPQQPPIDPSPLTEPFLWEVWYTSYDCGLVAIAVLLLLKTSLVIYAYNMDKYNRGLNLDAVSELTKALIRLNDQLVTAFTVIFLTIGTTVTRRYALYKAQQGAKLIDIEQLQASISLPSTMKMVISLRQFTKSSLLLVLLWSFYYTGSQASKREYTYVLGDDPGPLTVASPRSSAAFVNFNTSEWRGGPEELYSISKGSQSVAQESKVNPGIDTYGNMLLPRPNTFDWRNNKQNYDLFPDGRVNDTAGRSTRSSRTPYMLVGRPLLTAENSTQPLEDNQTVLTSSWYSSWIMGEFDMQTDYIKVNCRSLDLVPVTNFPHGVDESFVTSFNVTQDPKSVNSSVSQLQIWRRPDMSGRLSIDGSTPLMNGTQLTAIRYTCDPHQPRADIRVHCTEAGCTVNNIQWLRLDSSELNRTPFANDTFSKLFFHTLMLAQGKPDSREHSKSFIDDWYNVPNSTELEALAAGKTFTRATMYMEDASGTMETVLNTYINIIIKSNFYYWLQSSDSRAIRALDANPTPPPNCDIFAFTGRRWYPYYKIHWPWIAIDYFSGVLLLAAAIFSFWLRKHTLVPDIFGFVSSLTRDNPHFPVPEGGSTLNGIMRTRALRSMKVKIADVSSAHDDFGRLNFVSVQPEQPLQKLKRDRMYI